MSGHINKEEIVEIWTTFGGATRNTSWLLW